MMQKTKPHLQRITAFLTVILLLTSLLPSIAASFPWKTFIQGIARVADDVPVNKADDVAQSLARSKNAMRKLDADLLQAGKLTDKMDDAARAAAPQYGNAQGAGKSDS